MTADSAVRHRESPQTSRLRLWGAHGTSLSRAHSIRRDGFELKPGRIGVGAYFWTAVSNTDDCLNLARRLANRWATNCYSAGQYAQDAEQAVAILEVEVEVDRREVLSLDHPEMTYRLWSVLRSKLAKEFGIDGSDEAWMGIDLGRHHKLINGIIEGFILKLEGNMPDGVKFKIVFKTQGCPKYSDPILPYIGNHSCFAVRDAAVIQAMNIT